MTYKELDRKIKTAGAWYVGAFMSEFIDHYYEYCDDPEEKAKFIEYMYENYDGCNSFDTIKTKCYAIMAIVEEHKVVEALERVLECNDKKIIEEAKENAQWLLDEIKSGNVILP